jgi:exopolysaccharide biosynthesis polyprenyl glycosylphosphotransferase
MPVLRRAIAVATTARWLSFGLSSRRGSSLGAPGESEVMAMATNGSANAQIRLPFDAISVSPKVRRPPQVLLDSGVIAVACAIATGVGASPRLHWGWLVFYSFALVMLLAGGRTRRLRLEPLDELWVVVRSTSIAAMATISLSVLVQGKGDLAVAGAWLWLLTLGSLGVMRASQISARAAACRRGDQAAPTLIVGAGNVAQLTAKRLREQPQFGLKPVGFLDKEPLHDDSSELPVLGASWDLLQVLDQHQIRHVIFTFSTAPHGVLLRMMQQCLDRGVAVDVVPRLFERIPRRIDVAFLGALPLVSVRPSSPDDRRLKVKYAVDRGFAVLALVLLAPLLAALAIGVAFSVGRPILFRQRRVGLDRRCFEMLKFRSLCGEEPPEQDELPDDLAPGGADDPNRTPRFGNFIRNWSLDELPQLVNVARGEMSLIGPRPERPKYVESFSSRVYRYDDRHRLKSGITGWAQVHGLRGRTSLSDRVEWDNWYIENWSLWLDVKIALMTLRYFPASRATIGATLSTSPPRLR